MNFTEICIRRPVLTLVMSFLLVIVGAVSFSYLSVRQFPAYDQPIVSIQTGYEGASPQIIETLVTKPLEGALAGTEGLDYMISRSQPEGSYITLYFKPTRSLDDAANDVRDKIGKIRAVLPDGAKNPTIKKTEADAAAIIFLALSSDQHDITDLFNYADKQMKSELESLPGVASVDVSGGNDYVVHIWISPEKMSAFNITAQDLSSALKRQNVHVPAGRIRGEDREFSVNTSAKLKTPEEFGEVVISNHKGYPVKIKDVADIEFSSDEVRDEALYNDKPAVIIGIVKKSVSNPVEISKYLKKVLPKIRQNLPDGYSLEVAYDRTIFIQQSIKEVYKTFFEATLCVLLVILIFLWSFRAAAIPLVTIPVSLIATFTLLYMLGFTINTLTLLAIVLAIGLVVDDAIVMLENIYRYIEQGLSPFKAAIKGSKEISFAVIAMTLTLAAVYAPISLSQGIIGKIFTEFALTLAGAVIISGFVALSLSPMMCARLLKPHTGHTPFDRLFFRFENLYGRSLIWALKHRFIVFFFGGLFSLIGGLIAIDGIKKEMAPREDIGVIFTNSRPPVGATIDYIRKRIEEVENIFRDIPEVENRLATITQNESTTWNILKPWEQRSRTSLDIIQSVKQKLNDVTGVAAFAYPGSAFVVRSGGADNVQLYLETTKDFNKLNFAAEVLARAARQTGVFSRFDPDFTADTNEYIVDIDRSKAAALNVDVYAIAETLDVFVSGRKITDFKRDNEQFSVKVGVRPEKKMTADDLSLIYVRGKDNAMIPLSNLVTYKKDPTPMEILHYNQLRAIRLSGEISPSHSLGDAVEALNDLAAKNLPKGISYEFSGSTKDLIESSGTIYLIFGLAILFIYLIMAAQFESFTDPFIIMFTVPLSLTGAIISLKLTGGSLNVYTQIGLVTLIGLITKHGILIVDFANKIRLEGTAMGEAIHKATLLRLRPILMTTFAMAIGALPFLWTVGAGAVSRYQLGWTIFGGMMIGTLFTLYVIPVVYSLFAHKIVKDPSREPAKA